MEFFTHKSMQLLLDWRSKKDAVTVTLIDDDAATKSPTLAIDKQQQQQQFYYFSNSYLGQRIHRAAVCIRHT